MWSRRFGVRSLLGTGINWGFLDCAHLSLLPPWGNGYDLSVFFKKKKTPTRTLPYAGYWECPLLIFVCFSLWDSIFRTSRNDNPMRKLKFCDRILCKYLKSLRRTSIWHQCPNLILCQEQCNIIRLINLLFECAIS